jgi:hypothetical protein
MKTLKLQDVLTGKDILSYMYIILVWNDSTTRHYVVAKLVYNSLLLWITIMDVKLTRIYISRMLL